MGVLYGRALTAGGSGDTGGAAKETWVLNKVVEITPTQRFTAEFVSNGQTFQTISAESPNLLYNTTVVGRASSSGVGVGSLQISGWADEAYRKLTFSKPPAGDLLTWLQTNGVKQPDDTAIQNSKALTITSNGAVTIRPDAPYNALKMVNVTVNVVSEEGTTTSVEVNCDPNNTIDMPIYCIWQTENGWMRSSNFSITNPFTIPDVLVGGYVIFSKDPTDQNLFVVANASGVHVLDANPPEEIDTEINASFIVKVVDTSAGFDLSIAVA